MTDSTEAVADARAVALAAASFARAGHGGDGERFALASDRLEFHAERAMSRADPGPVESDEEVLAVALSRMGIGTTLLAADSYGRSRGAHVRERSVALDVAVGALEGTADDLEAQQREPESLRGFDAAPDGEPLDVLGAVLAALDEMVEAAVGVVEVVWEKTAGAVISRLPEGLGDIVESFVSDTAGVLVRCGLRAVRGALDLLLRLVDVPTVERLRDVLDGLLERWADGVDPGVLLGSVIGADDVRDRMAAGVPDPGLVRDDVVGELGATTARYVRLCRMLRGTAVVAVGIGTYAAGAGAGVPAVVAGTGAVLLVVLAATVVLGRDHTGATDLPGRTRSVQVLVPTVPRASA